MIVTVSASFRVGRGLDVGGSPGLKTSSKLTIFGVAFSRGQDCIAVAPKAGSLTSSKRGWESLIMAANSAGDWREYSGTTISPSAMSARSKAAQRMEFGASKA